ncbi:MAG: hypothetical protein ACE5EK_01475 [Nitrospinales bacterium]
MKSAQDDLKVISEIRQKMEALSEYVESRKGALEEEIDEKLHEAVANARDSLELIQENLEPKTEKFIQEKLKELDAKLSNWKSDFRLTAREEIRKESDSIVKKVLHELEAVMESKYGVIKRDMLMTLRGEVEGQVKSSLEDFKKNTREELKKARLISYIALGLSILVSVAVLGLLMMN